MPSSKLSGRRGTARKPSICISKPPLPIITPPPPPCDCWISPHEDSVETGSDVPVDLYANLSTYGLGDPVAAEYSATGGTFTGPNPIGNDIQDEGLYEADVEPGNYTLYADFTWPDETHCQEEHEITVTGEGPP